MDLKTQAIYSLFCDGSLCFQDRIMEVFNSAKHSADMTNKCRDVTTEFIMNAVGDIHPSIQYALENYLESSLLDVDWDEIHKYMYGHYFDEVTPQEVS